MIRRRRLEVRAEPTPARWAACYAPHSTMYFDQFGSVRACCQASEASMGRIGEQTIRGVWEGARAEAMRAALEADDYSQGCFFCGWQVSEGGEADAFARIYDEHRPDERRPVWPRRMEFALTNACNLRCTMCTGDYSSAIRIHREGREPLPPAYGDAFFDELAEFLPHLESVGFAGGEPFLGAEPLRVLGMLAELERPPTTSIITNATQWSARVEAILEQVRPHLTASIDGATAATFDAIRVGAHLDDVLANLDRYEQAVGPGRVSITTCVMRSNWHELARLLELAAERGWPASTNVVVHPDEESLYRLAPEELQEVLRSMRADPPQVGGDHLAVWERHLGLLERRSLAVEAGAPQVRLPWEEEPTAPMPTSRWPWLPFPEQGAPVDPPATTPRAGPLVEVRLDTEARARVVRSDAGAPAQVPSSIAALEPLHDLLEAAFGPPGSWPIERRRPGVDDDRYLVRLREGPDAVVMVGRARRDERGALVGASLTIVALADLPVDEWPRTVLDASG